MSRLRAVRRCAVAVLLGVSLASFAQGYPAKPIRLIVPYAQAGGTDISARIVAQKMSEEIRQQIIVENRVGAGGIVGTEAAAKLPGDGYTVLLVSATTRMGGAACRPREASDRGRKLQGSSAVCIVREAVKHN